MTPLFTLARRLCSSALACTVLAVMAVHPAQATSINGGASSSPAKVTYAVKTRFEPTGSSLEQLLNQGFVIQSSDASEAGSAVFLVRPAHDQTPAKWVRCELIGDHNGTVMLRASHAVSSDCRALN